MKSLKKFANCFEKNFAKHPKLAMLFLVVVYVEAGLNALFGMLLPSGFFYLSGLLALISIVIIVIGLFFGLINSGSQEEDLLTADSKPNELANLAKRRASLEKRIQEEKKEVTLLLEQLKFADAQAYIASSIEPLTAEIGEIDKKITEIRSGASAAHENETPVVDLDKK